MSGTFEILVWPCAKSEAAMSLSTEFLAPVTETSPLRRAPPVIRKRSWEAKDPLAVSGAELMARVYFKAGNIQ